MPKVNKVVEKQAQLAEEMYQKAYGKTEESAPAKEETGMQNPQPTESQPAEATQESAPQQTDGVQAEEVKPAENAIEKPKQKFPDADPNDPSWEHKYKVIANKYAAEVPRYAAEVRSLKSEIEDLKQRLTTQQPPAQPAAGQISPEEVEEYGEKFVDFVKRAARDGMPNSDVDGLKQSVEEVRKEQTKLARTRFFDELGALSPQWQSLNEDKEFLGFLADIDPYTGQQRQVLFDDAYAQLDAWRVANFFNAFESGQPRTEPAPQKPSLEPQVTPKVTGRTAPPPGKKIYSTVEVARFYDDMRRGKYSADEAARIESDIFAAQAEGRFR
jgi:hypothetical protein